MTKPKKLTYKELESHIIKLQNYIQALDNKYSHAVNTIGKTITDYIEFKNHKEEFMEYLEDKYGKKEDSDAMRDVQKEDKKEPKSKIHRI